MRLNIFSLALLVFAFSGHASPPAVQRHLQEEGESRNSSALGSDGKEAPGEGGNAAVEASAVPAEGEGEEEEETVDVSSIAGAVLLMTCLAIGMILLSLLNCRNERIRYSTWKLVNAVVSVFVACCHHSAVDVVLDDWLGPEEAEDTPSTQRVMAATVHFIFWVAFLVTINILMARCGRALTMSFTAVNQVFSHICSFGAQGCVNALMHADPFDVNASYGLLATILFFCVLLLIGAIGKRLIVQIIPADCADIVRDAQTELELDVVSVATGFSLVQTCRFAFTNEVPTAELLQGAQSPELGESLGVAGCGILFAVMALVLLGVQTRLGIRKNIGCELSKLTCVLSSVWFWIFWGDMQIGTIPDIKFLGLVLMATVYSAAGVLGVVALEAIGMIRPAWISGEAVDLAIAGFSWIVALPWEQVFDVASEAIAKSQQTISAPTTKLIVSVLMAAIVAPPWFLYILPRTIEEEKEIEAEEAQATYGQDSTAPARS